MNLVKKILKCLHVEPWGQGDWEEDFHLVLSTSSINDIKSER